MSPVVASAGSSNFVSSAGGSGAGASPGTLGVAVSVSSAAGAGVSDCSGRFPRAASSMSELSGYPWLVITMPNVRDEVVLSYRCIAWALILVLFTFIVDNSWFNWRELGFFRLSIPFSTSSCLFFEGRRFSGIRCTLWSFLGLANGTVLGVWGLCFGLGCGPFPFYGSIWCPLDCVVAAILWSVPCTKAISECALSSVIIVTDLRQSLLHRRHQQSRPVVDRSAALLLRQPVHREEMFHLAVGDCILGIQDDS